MKLGPEHLGRINKEGSWLVLKTHDLNTETKARIAWRVWRVQALTRKN